MNYIHHPQNIAVLNGLRQDYSDLTVESLKRGPYRSQGNVGGNLKRQLCATDYCVRPTMRVSLTIIAVLSGSLQLQAQTSVEWQGRIATQNHALSDPPDLTHYVRPAIPQDYAPAGRPALPQTRISGYPIFPTVNVIDTVVNNTDPNLTNTDTYNDTEPSLAINPISCLDRNRGCRIIVLLAFSGEWTQAGSFAPLWLSTDGGGTWSKDFAVPIPPNAPGTDGCPCDQTPDYGNGDELAATFLAGKNVYSGSTSSPAESEQWNWLISHGAAQRTNSYGVNDSDQPWLLVNADPERRSQNDAYVGYDNFEGAPDIRVAVSYGTTLLDFTTDSLVGYGSAGSGDDINPGQRLAVDPRNGTVYSLFQQCVADCAYDDPAKTISYILNRSLDGGLTWSLNGSSTGAVIATAQSTQARPKFGTVNALLGGVDHVVVDPRTGDVYVVYGDRDPSTQNNRLSIIRLTDNGSGGLTIGPSFFVTGQVQAALPSVAIANDDDRSVGVLYDTYDGMESGYPQFSAHLAVSSDHGMTFQDVILETFLSPSQDNGNDRQRVLGDYQQLKSIGNGFYGVFTGNGVPFGRPFSNTDPIFFKTFTGRPL